MDFLMRSTPTLGLMKPKIDRTNNVIHGAVGMTAFTEALGHNVMADLVTLEQFADQGNAKKNGVRGRLGHPGISEQSTGKQVQIAKNFRVSGDKLVHDMHLVNFARKSPAFSQDPIEFILDAAENYPSEIGESVVASVDLYWIFDEEGNGQELSEEEYHLVHWGLDRHPDSIYQWPVMRLREGGFKYIDVVSEGALTHEGLFEVSLSEMFQGRSSQFGLELFTLIDRWRKQYNIPLEELELKSKQLLEKYLFTRSRKEDDMSITDEAIARRAQTRNLGRQAMALEAQPTIPEVDPEGTETEQEEMPEVDAPEEELEADETPQPTPPVTPPTPQPAGTAEIKASVNPLEAAEKLMAELSAKETEQAEAKTQFDALAGRVKELSEKVDKLTGDLARASDLLANQAEWIGRLSNNVARIDGERVVKETVPRFSTNQHDRLEPVMPNSPQDMIQNSHPVPNANRFSAGIDGMPQGLILAGDTPQTAAEKAIQNQTRRQQAYRLQGSQSLPR